MKWPLLITFGLAKQSTLPLPPTLSPNAQVVKLAPLNGAPTPFGGTDHKTLYIAARTGFYSVDTNVRGGNPAK
jgi:hypothetical protein